MHGELIRQAIRQLSLAANEWDQTTAEMDQVLAENAALKQALGEAIQHMQSQNVGVPERVQRAFCDLEQDIDGG